MHVHLGAWSDCKDHGSDCRRLYNDHEYLYTVLPRCYSTFVLYLQTSETPLHYCARSGNADVLLEIVKYLGSNRVQTAVNKQAKVRWHQTDVDGDVMEGSMQQLFDVTGALILHMIALSS